MAMAATFPPLETVTKPNVSTPEAAYYLNRAGQTLRIWACKENGPIRPTRVHGRLAWPTDKLKALLGIAAVNTPSAPQKRRNAHLAVVAGAV